ncbi:MAG: family 1 glycosylhydrolase [Roseburia sp.]|nr:family 1 glycosylhydrolase [Roseburia sp.]MCM1098962.1 family 1 glycosylhydrolase [Ruminococcus flavefaciens]
MNKFSPDFLLGAATAAHQVEGNNTNSDCWAMEQMKHTSFAEPSLDAVDHYHRYQEDIRLMAEAGLNAYRFSVEWARIEPSEGHFDDSEAAHYLDVIRCCREHGLEPIVTLHHFSSPKWLIGKGGWEAESTVEDFARYVRYIVGKLGGELRYICTINEANMGIQVAAIAKRYMLQMQAQAAKAQSADGTVQVGINLEKMMAGQKAAAAENKEVFGVEKVENFTSMRTPNGDRIVCRAHEAARAVIRELYPEIKVGLTLSLHDIQAQAGGEENARKEWADEFTHYLPFIQEDDFLGVQNYTRSLLGPEGTLPSPEGAELTQMNYEFYPEALEHVIRRVAEDFKGDLIVTENGIATDNDDRRVAFIDCALSGVQNCLRDGLPVKGYFYWSLMDNFEWQKGYSMTFGLIAVDRTTQTRQPKESLSFLGSFR